jgi:hypothetical protein
MRMWIWPSSRCRRCCPRPRRMRRCGWCWRTTATTPPAANPAKVRTPCWSWTSSAPSPRAWTARSTWPSECGMSVSRSWSPPRVSRASVTIVRPRDCWPLRRRDRRAAVSRPGAAAGPGRPVGGAGAQLGAGLPRPPGAGQGPLGERPRIDPEAVRQAQPGEAWVIQAGQSIHLRVLPPPAVAPEPVELGASLPLADDTIPLPAAEEPAPVGIAAAVALTGRITPRAGQRVGHRRERAGRLPTPVRRPWQVGRPMPGRGRR